MSTSRMMTTIRMRRIRRDLRMYSGSSAFFRVFSFISLACLA